MLRENACRHFTGIMNEECELGIKYHDVTPNPEVTWGRALRLPCMILTEAEKLRMNGEVQGVCEKLDLPTAEEVRIADEESDRRFAAKMQKLKDGFCLVCDQPMTKKQVGSCVYADPCGHRLYQGKA